MKRAILSFSLIVLVGLARLEAHAFLKSAEPSVGSTVQASSNEVRLLFTENIEPAFSNVQVFDASGKQVDKRDLHLDGSNHALLHVSLRGGQTPSLLHDAWHGPKVLYKAHSQRSLEGGAEANDHAAAGQTKYCRQIHTRSGNQLCRYFSLCHHNHGGAAREKSNSR
jgi:methionine-rich copper-binding protein CopC